MKKRNLALALTTAAMSAFAVAGLCACGDDEPQADYGPDQFVYNQGINDWTKLEYPDAGMKMDGKVESSEYGEKYLSFSDVNGVNMKVYAHMGEEGVFLAFNRTTSAYIAKRNKFITTRVSKFKLLPSERKN